MNRTEHNGLTNLASMLLVFGLILLVGLGCKLDLGQKADPSPTPTDEKTSNDKKDEGAQAETPTPAPTAAPPSAPSAPKTVPAPPGSTVGRCTGNGVLLRADPDQGGRKVGSIKRNQRLYILEYGDLDTIKGVEEPWVYVQTEEGNRGWVFGQYVSQN